MMMAITASWRMRSAMSESGSLAFTFEYGTYRLVNGRFQLFARLARIAVAKQHGNGIGVQHLKRTVLHRGDHNGEHDGHHKHEDEAQLIAGEDADVF